MFVLICYQSVILKEDDNQSLTLIKLNLLVLVLLHTSDLSNIHVSDKSSL